MRRLHVLLPQRGRASMDADALGRLARADRLVSSDPGHLHLLGDLFDWPGTSLPAGALMREHVAHDAGQEVWLCADPAWVEADINGARMMACGNLELEQNESEEFAATLRPVLGDMGLMLELTTATRWHVRLPVGAALPPFAAPDQVLGDDLLRHLDGQARCVAGEPCLPPCRPSCTSTRPVSCAANAVSSHSTPCGSGVVAACPHGSGPAWKACSVTIPWCRPWPRGRGSDGATGPV